MDFRFWLRQMWYEYVKEHEDYGQRPLLKADEYFQRYKYWLKREYRHQHGKAKKTK